MSHIAYLYLFISFFLPPFLPFHFLGTSGILVPRPGIEPVPLAMKVPSPNYWTAREFQDSLLYQIIDQRETKHAENKKGVSKSSWDDSAM